MHSHPQIHINKRQTASRPRQNPKTVDKSQKKKLTAGSLHLILLVGVVGLLAPAQRERTHERHLRTDGSGTACEEEVGCGWAGRSGFSWLFSRPRACSASRVFSVTLLDGGDRVVGLDLRPVACASSFGPGEGDEAEALVASDGDGERDASAAAAPPAVVAAMALLIAMMRSSTSLSSVSQSVSGARLKPKSSSAEVGHACSAIVSIACAALTSVSSSSFACASATLSASL